MALQLAVGGVYAWSVFAQAFTRPETMGLSKVQAAIPFELAIGMIVVGASVGGRLQDKYGPRIVALLGIALYGSGVMLSSLARNSSDLWIIIVGYGVIGGFGLGLAYVVPIAMLQKWFPDRAALVTGLAVGGFGFGAVLTSPVAQALISTNPDAPAKAFIVLGVIYLVLGLGGAAFFANPETKEKTATGAQGATVGEALRSPQWYLLTASLCLAVIAGISLVSVAATAMVDVAGFSPAGAAAAVGMLGLFNGGGRIVWAWISDKLGKTRTLALMLVLQGSALLILPHATNPVFFLILAGVVYLCYGGAFGVLPSAAGKFFGLANLGAIYGLMLIGWSLGGVMGPLLVASVAGTPANWTLAFSVVGVIALLASGVPLLARPRTVATSSEVRDTVEAATGLVDS